MLKVNIPAAFQAFTTVQMLAPVAKYAPVVTTDMHLNGPLGKNMMPLFSALTGRGTLQTSNVALHDFPAMNKIVDVTKLQILNNPTMEAIKTAFKIKEGRLFLQPFDVKLGGDHDERRGLQRDRPVAGVHPGAQGAAVAAGRRANEALAGLVSKAGRRGSTSMQRRRFRSRFSSAAR